MKRKPKKAPLPRRMTPEERRDFVEAFCNGTVTCSLDLPGRHLLARVFLPIALGAGELFRGWTERDFNKIGLIWADRARDHTTGMAINGHPMFLSCRLMLASDWKSLRPKVFEELKRRKEFRP